jgi:hypothetical protein
MPNVMPHARSGGDPATALTKQIRNFAFKCQNVFQEGFNTFVHWVSPLCRLRKGGAGGWSNDSAIRRARACRLTKDEARWIAANIVQLPSLLRQ